MKTKKDKEGPDDLAGLYAPSPLLSSPGAVVCTREVVVVAPVALALHV